MEIQGTQTSQTTLQENKVERLTNLNFYYGDFPGGPAVKTLHISCRVDRFNFWLEN